METVGTSVPRLDAIEKVTGRATYVGDIKRSGMLHAKILPSPIPRARITAIDTTAAQQLPGVVAVLTREHLHDIDPYYGSTIRDRPIVAIDKVRYQGEPVAAVAAVDERTAQQALELIEVTYEELPSAPSPARHQPRRCLPLPRAPAHGAASACAAMPRARGGGRLRRASPAAVARSLPGAPRKPRKQGITGGECASRRGTATA
jgi:CO/xanthine dehydrogenase Mo-binding subunit